MMHGDVLYQFEIDETRIDTGFLDDAPQRTGEIAAPELHR
jgi:hypothetical protein